MARVVPKTERIEGYAPVKCDPDTGDHPPLVHAVEITENCEQPPQRIPRRFYLCFLAYRRGTGVDLHAVHEMRGETHGPLLIIDIADGNETPIPDTWRLATGLSARQLLRLVLDHAPFHGAPNASAA